MMTYGWVCRVLAWAALLAGTAAVAEDRPTQLYASALPARAPTASERTRIVAEHDAAVTGRASLLAALGGGGPPPKHPKPTRWGQDVPVENRALGLCLQAFHAWNADLRAATGRIDNACGMSLRVRASYGFASPAGPCAVVGRMDGILLPGGALPDEGRKSITWIGSDDQTRQACIAAIDLLGVPLWPVEQARAARAYLVDEVKNGYLTELTEYLDDNTVRSGPVSAATSDDLCLLTLSSPAYGRYDGPKTASDFVMRWADVTTVGDVNYNKFVSIKTRGPGRSRSLEFSNFGDRLAATGFDPTVAVMVLSEYCRAADDPDRTAVRPVASAAPKRARVEPVQEMITLGQQICAPYVTRAPRAPGQPYFDRMRAAGFTVATSEAGTDYVSARYFFTRPDGSMTVSVEGNNQRGCSVRAKLRPAKPEALRLITAFDTQKAATDPALVRIGNYPQWHSPPLIVLVDLEKTGEVAIEYSPG